MGIPDSFLLDEVRCGFMIPTPVKQAWAAQLEVLMEIDRVCKKHNIEYFADWGTLLGAVRHGGFIPWDDDLDIVMKRADYEQFMNVARFDLEEGFDVQTFRNQKDFWLFMGKVVGKNRFCFEKEHLRRFHNFPYIACVDIFVLDYVYRDPVKEEKRRVLCKYMLGVADAIVEGTLTPAERDKCFEIIEEMGGGKIRPISDSVEMGRFLYGEVEKLFAAVPECEADELTQLFPWGLKGKGLHISKEVYVDPIYLPFECTKIPVPRLYDKMLRMRYGDYMKLVKSGGGHNYPFFEGQKENLLKVLDFDLPEFKLDVDKIKRSDQEASYKNLSYKVMARECAEELGRLKEAIISNIEKGIYDTVVPLIQDSQQLAIDMGTMLEQIKGEGCSVVASLERYCEALFNLYEQLAANSDTDVIRTGIDRLNSVQEELKAKLDSDIFGKKTKLFLPVLAKDWSGLQEIWEQAVDDPERDVYVVALPYYYKDYDGSPKEIFCDASYFPESVEVIDYRVLTEEYLEMLHPEMIFIQNPYDNWNPVMSVHPMYYAENIRKYTDKLVCVTNFAVEDFNKENDRAYANMKYYVNMPGVVYADEVWVPSEAMKQAYIDKLTEFVGEGTKKVWEEKIVLAEVCKELEDTDKGTVEHNIPRKKKLLYGISLGTYLENEQKADEKIARSMQIFDTYKDVIDVTVLHFPEETECNVAEYDAYYGDPMPIVTEFMQAGKPVMVQNVEI